MEASSQGGTSLSSGRIFKPEFFGKTAGQNGSGGGTFGGYGLFQFSGISGKI